MKSDVPSFTEHEARSIIYIYEVNQQLQQDKPASIKQLQENTDYPSRYYTRAWKRLEPENVVKREKDGKNTRLELTEGGKEVAQHLLDINKVLSDAV